MVQAGRDQAKRSASFLRYAMKAIPRKPRIIVVQVEGSGTAETFSVTSKTSLELLDSEDKTHPLSCG